MLIQDESILKTSNKDVITLTNLRIIQRVDKDIATISLDKVSCIKVHYVSKWYYLVIGVPGTFFGLMAVLNSRQESVISFGILLIGVIFLLSYYFSRKHSVSIISDSGTSIDFQTQGIKNEDVIAFINDVDKAKIELMQKVI